MAGFSSAVKYAYSNARVKAMESKLIRSKTLEQMLAAKEPGSIAAMLLQTDYKPDIDQFGGVKAMDTLIDFALNKNLGRESSKLISIVPSDQKSIIINIAGTWDIDNIRLAIESAGLGKEYDYVSKYVIDARYTGPALVKEALAAKSVEGTIEKFMQHTPYQKILRKALDAYKKTHNTTETNTIIEKEFYFQLGSTIRKLINMDRAASILIKKTIDMKNMVTLLRAKRYGLDFSKVVEYMLPNGALDMKGMEKVFRDSKSVEELAQNAKMFDLGDALASYKKSTHKPLILFEIGMRTDIFKRALKTVKNSVLSFGAIIAYFYLKEIEVFTLRILIKGKAYGLSDEEIRGMISWFK